jgi:hypothetical protein
MPRTNSFFRYRKLSISIYVYRQCALVWPVSTAEGVLKFISTLNSSHVNQCVGWGEGYGGVNAEQSTGLRCESTTAGLYLSLVMLRHAVSCLLRVTLKQLVAPGTVLAGTETSSTALMR